MIWFASHAIYFSPPAFLFIGGLIGIRYRNIQLLRDAENNARTTIWGEPFIIDRVINVEGLKDGK